MRPKRMKIQLFKVANFLWGGGEGSRLVVVLKFCVLEGLYIRSVFNNSLSDMTVLLFFNALFSAVTSDFHQLVLVRSWNGFLYRNITYKRNVLLTIAFRWIVNRTHIITLTVQRNTMRHRKCCLPASPKVIYLTQTSAVPFPLSAAPARKKLISALPVSGENNNNVVNTIPCRVELSNKRHPRVTLKHHTWGGTNLAPRHLFV